MIYSDEPKRGRLAGSDERDVDLRNWLFGFGDGVRIETPSAMQEEHRAKAAAVVDIYQV